MRPVRKSAGDDLLAEFPEPGGIDWHEGPVSHGESEVGRGSRAYEFKISLAGGIQVTLDPTSTIVVTEPVLLLTIDVANQQRLGGHGAWDDGVGSCAFGSAPGAKSDNELRNRGVGNSVEIILSSVMPSSAMSLIGGAASPVNKFTILLNRLKMPRPMLTV